MDHITIQSHFFHFEKHFVACVIWKRETSLPFPPKPPSQTYPKEGIERNARNEKYMLIFTYLFIYHLMSYSTCSYIFYNLHISIHFLSSIFLKSKVSSETMNESTFLL